MNTRSQLLQHIVALLVIAVAGILVMWPLTHTGLFTAHDIWHQVARFYHYHDVLSTGTWPPGWVATLANGYGYPLFYFSYHLPWMVGEVLLRLGFSLPVALKILFGGAVVVSGWTMYAFSWAVTRKWVPSLVAAIVYIIAPYHFLSVYVAAAIGTVFQFVFVPLMFLGSLLITRRTRRSVGIILLGLGLAGSILSHLMLTVMILPFLLIWTVGCVLIFAKSSKTRWTSLVADFLITGVLACLLSAFYLLPLVTYKSAIVADSVDGFRELYKLHFVSAKQLLYSSWGYGPITTEAKNGEVSFQVGIVQWLGVAGLSVVVLLSLLITKTNKSRLTGARAKIHNWMELLFEVPKNLGIVVLLLFLFLLACIGMLDISAPAWLLANVFMTLDYPWRLLLLAVFFGSATIGLLLASIRVRALQLALAVLIISAAWYTNRNHIGVNLYTEIPVADYVEAESTTNSYSEYLPKGAYDKVMFEHYSFVLEPEAVATVTAQTAISIDASVSTTQSGTFTLRHYSFPTVVISVDGQEVQEATDPSGLSRIPLSQGTQKVVISAVQPSSSRVGGAISVVSAIALFAYILWKIARSYAKK